MESPLTQQSRPDHFKPKIVQLYENLFQVCAPPPTFVFIQIILTVPLQTTDYTDPSEGFWKEFFLLPPDRAQLRSVLDQLSPDEVLNLQVGLLVVLFKLCLLYLVYLTMPTPLLTRRQAQTQQLFARAVREAASGIKPVDSYALEVCTLQKTLYFNL